MSSINLSQSNLERSRQESGTIFDKSLVISLSLIVLSFGSLFGLNAYNSVLEKNVVAANDTITTHLKELESDSVNRVVDFQERLTNIDAKLAVKDISSQDMFALVEKSMVSGASLGSYVYNTEAKTLTVKIVASDFKIVAQQIMNFKSVSAFTSVIVSDALKGNDGVVTSNVIISL
ncbi:MAG: hypothetical protein PHT88_04965 [Candidatus Moranbacteria bacterium]|nr:hypothetical protein [Candidatus Moranbacteria bacterium]